MGIAEDRKETPIAAAVAFGMPIEPIVTSCSYPDGETIGIMYGARFRNGRYIKVERTTLFVAEDVADPWGSIEAAIFEYAENPPTERDRKTIASSWSHETVDTYLEVVPSEILWRYGIITVRLSGPPIDRHYSEDSRGGGLFTTTEKNNRMFRAMQKAKGEQSSTSP